MAGINRRTFLRGAAALGGASLLGGIEKIVLGKRKAFAQAPTTRLTGKDFIHALRNNHNTHYKINPVMYQEKAYAQVTESNIPFTCGGFYSPDLQIPYTPEVPTPYAPEELPSLATSGTPIVQEYNLRTGQLSTTDIAQRLATSDEYLQFVEGVNFNAINNGNHLSDALLGAVSSLPPGLFSKEANWIYWNKTADIANRKLIKDLSPRVRTIKLMIDNQITDIIFIYDGATQITASDLNTGQSFGNVNQPLKDIFGFLPVDMISANVLNQNSSPEDDYLLLKNYDGEWMLYAWNKLSQGTAVNLESFVADPSYAVPTSLGALNLGNEIDSLYIVRFPRQGTVSDVQAAQDINTMWNYGNYSLIKWDLPVPVFIHPSVNRRTVVDRLEYLRQAQGTNYVLIEQDILPRLIVKAHPNGSYAGIDEVYPNRRAKSGFAYIHPNFVSDPEVISHEMEHVFGFAGHDTVGLMAPDGGDGKLTQGNINMMRVVYFKVPHSTMLQYNGLWNVV